MAEHMVADQLGADLAVAHKHEFAQSVEHHHLDCPSKEEGHPDDDGYIDDFLNRLIFFKPYRIEEMMDVDQ